MTIKMMPDPVADKCRMLENELEQLKERLVEIEKSAEKEGNLL